MREQIDNLIERIDALTLRERALIFLTLLAVLVAIWYAALMTPLEEREARVSGELDAVRHRIEVLNASVQAAAASLGEDPEAHTRILSARVAQQLAEVDAELRQFTTDLIDPAEMTYVLEDVLSRQRDLRLLRMKNLGAESLLPADAFIGAQEAGLYKHALEIELQGSYLACLGYLRELEALQWRIFWERFELEVDKYPRNLIRIRIHTLSLDEEWIGV